MPATPVPTGETRARGEVSYAGDLTGYRSETKSFNKLSRLQEIKPERGTRDTFCMGTKRQQVTSKAGNNLPDPPVNNNMLNWSIERLCRDTFNIQINKLAALIKNIIKDYATSTGKRG